MRVVLLLAVALCAEAADAERNVVAYLARETPRWSAENGCFSCHNNGDAARALFLAGSRGLTVPPGALTDTLRWLSDPAAWDRNRGNPAFSDKRLARLQFAAALAEAVRSGATRDREALARAAASLLPEQAPDGSWPVDTGGAPAAPATWGTALATYMSRRTLETADEPRFADAVARANHWLSAAEPRNLVDRAAILLAEPGSAVQAAILAAQTSDGGWGPQPHVPAEAFDTALALLALAGAPPSSATAAAVARGRAFLEKLQLPDGSWPETTRPAGFTSYAERVSTAGWAAYALLMTAAQAR